MKSGALDKISILVAIIKRVCLDPRHNSYGVVKNLPETTQCRRTRLTVGNFRKGADLSEIVMTYGFKVKYTKFNLIRADFGGILLPSTALLE